MLATMMMAGGATADPDAPKAGDAPADDSKPPASTEVTEDAPIDPDAPPPPPEPVAEAPEETQHVYVRGRQAPPSRGASDFVLPIGELGIIPRANASELLRLAPGILLTNEGGDGHAEQVFLRGFDAREGQDIEFTVGGVPINEAGNIHANGYSDTHFIIPELVQSLRVLEGPYDPRQGNFAVAGSADYRLGLPRRGLTAKYMRGSFNTDRLLLTWGPKFAGTHTFGGAELFRSDGFGQNRQSRRASGIAQYEGRLGDKGSYRLTGTAYANDYKSAGVVREDDWEAGKIDFYGTYDPRQGGQSTRFSIAADLEARVDRTTFYEQVFLIYRGVRFLENFTGFLQDVQEPQQSIHGQRGDLLDRSTNSLTIGNRGWARTRFNALNMSHEAEVGYFARWDKVDATEYRNTAETNVPYRLDRSYDAKLADIGLYGDVNLHVLPWISLRGGVRAELFTFDVLNRCAQKKILHASYNNPPGDASCLSQQDFGYYREPVERITTATIAVMPRATLLVGPIKHFSLSVNYGQGVRSIDPIYINQDTKTPLASIESYDAGLTYANTFSHWSVTARSIFFQTHVDQDMVFNATEGRRTLASGTTRTGWTGSMRLTGHFLDESAHVTLVRSTFDDTHLLVPYVPDVVARSDTALFADLPWKLRGEAIRAALGAGITFVGRRALPFGERSNVIFTTDLSATLNWTMFELGIVATNVFDRQYRLGEYNTASDFRNPATNPGPPTLVPMRQFTAGAPRAIFASIGITLGGL